MTISRPLSRIAATLSVGAVLLGTPALAGASGTPSAASVISATSAQLLKEKSVHIAVTSVSTTTKSSISVDLGLSKGQEFLVSGTMKVAVIVTPKAAYLSGNALGLTTVMGLTSAQQSKMGTKWVIMPKGTTPYTNLAKNLTTAALALILPQSKGTKLSASTDKAKDYRLTWATSSGSAAKATNVLLISSGTRRLPISQTISTTTGHGSTKYSKWNQDFSVKVPKKSKTVSYKSVFG